jgi:hypothetical protein
VSQDCVTTAWGALDETTGNFVAGSWSPCFGLCNGNNYGGKNNIYYKLYFYK